MTPDTVKTLFTYLLALVVVIGAGVLLIVPTPDLAPEAKIGLVGGAVGTVLGYVFSDRSADRAVERSIRMTGAAGPPTDDTPSD